MYSNFCYMVAVSNVTLNTYNYDYMIMTSPLNALGTTNFLILDQNIIGIKVAAVWFSVPPVGHPGPAPCGWRA